MPYLHLQSSYGKTYTMKLLSKFYILSVVTLSCIHLNAYSQDYIEDKTDEVVITSDRLDLPLDRNSRDITIITSKEIALLPARSINDILAHVSGIDVRQRGVNGAQADISIDGGTFDQLIVLINGHKMSDPQTGHNMMNVPIAIDAIERIEILRGPAASRYGVNGLTGVINIVTKSSSDKALFVSAHVGSNFQNDSATHNLYNNKGIQLTEMRSLHNWSHLISLSYDQSNGYRKNSAYQNFKALLTFNYKLSERADLHFTSGYVFNKFNARDYYAYPRDANSIEQVETYMLGLKMPIKILNKGTLQPYITYRYGYDDYIFVKDNPLLFRNQHHAHVLDGGVDYTFQNNLGKNAIGFNGRFESINSTNLGERQRSNWGVFIENYNRWSVLDLRLGVFADYNSVFGFNVYPHVELGSWLSPQWRIYANAGLGQRLPTFTDLYYTSPNNIGNDMLSPEKAFNVEGGLQYKSNDVSASLGSFYRMGYDMIDWIRKDTSEAWQVYNFSRINTFGFKANVQYNWDWDAVRFSLKSSYTYLSPDIAQSSDPDKVNYMSQYTINALKHHWTTQLSMQLHGYSFTLGHRYMHRFVSDASIHPDLKAQYNVIDALIQKQFKHFNLGLQIQNITSTTYIEAGMVTMPGMWTSLRFQFRMY